MVNPVKSFFLFCSGANREVLGLKGCHVEQGKYAGIGATIFFTAVLASLSGGYAMFRVFGDVTLAFSFGVLWALIIFNLDRFIVSSVRKKKRPANITPPKRVALWAGELFKALPRLILAVFISVIITRPLELKLFQKELEGQLTRDLTAERITVEQGIRDEYSDLETLERETNNLKERQKTLEDEINQRVKAMRGELAGWAGTLHSGPGPIYGQRSAEVDEAKAALDIFNKQYAATITANEEEIKRRAKARDEKITEAKGRVDPQMGGLLRQLEALSTLTSERPAVYRASLFIMLLFISLETAPILVKLFSSRGPYDDYLDAIEHQVYARQLKRISDENDRINNANALSKQTNVIRLQERLRLYQNMWANLSALAPAELQAAQAEVALREIARWKARQLNQPNGPLNPHISPHTVVTQSAQAAPP
ncbi:MAG TPA: DUF4407 domain-containing protein, partial [Pyrinomonadaceae bacterium]